MSENINVEVVYALPDNQTLIKVQVPEGSTVKDALAQSHLAEKFPELDLGGTNKVGIYGKVVKLDASLRDLDRIEVYRPLIADPKTAKRKKKSGDQDENTEE